MNDEPITDEVDFFAAAIKRRSGRPTNPKTITDKPKRAPGRPRTATGKANRKPGGLGEIAVAKGILKACMTAKTNKDIREF